MIDYNTIIIKGIAPSILESNPLLDFYDNINLSTGEIKTTNHKGQKITPFKNAYYNGLEFRIYETGLIKVLGSLHKYWNSGAHNYNDFDFNAFLDVLTDLKHKFNIDAENCILKCLEVGININPPLYTNDILNYTFLHSTKGMEWQKNNDEGKYKQCEHSQYKIKLYNKALHYKSKGFDIKDEILRFEINYKKMQKVNNLGVFNLQDIADKGFGIFKNALLTEWFKLLFFDTTIKNNSKRLLNYNNPTYWTELLQRPTKRSYYKHKKILNELTQNYSDNIQEKISNIISKKIDVLNTKGARIDRLSIRSKLTPLQLSKDRKCLVTGLNISMQKDSILLSHTGLKYYYNTDKKIYSQIKRKHLTKKWLNADIETQIKEIAHNIRDCHRNQKSKQQRLYLPNQKTLFDIAI